MGYRRVILRPGMKPPRAGQADVMSDPHGQPAAKGITAVLNRHLSAAAESVFASHARQPVAVVLDELVARATMPGFEPDPDYLRPAALAISEGDQYEFS
jgi:hypothetical protein